MQQQALAHCTSGAERRGVNEAITYFAEITSHRLFRSISPGDHALREATIHGGMSVADAMNGLTLVTPDRLLTHGHAPADGLERLELHCSDWLGSTYREIHKPSTTYPLSPNAEWSNTVDEVGPLKAMSQIDERTAEFMPDRKRDIYLKESKKRANTMRTAAALRAEGEGWRASLLEAEVREKNISPSSKNTAPRR